MNKRAYQVGSGNAFADIGLPKADEHLVKAQLVFQDRCHCEDAQDEANGGHRAVDVRQPDISKMLRGEFRQFSVERLMRFLVKLDQDVQIVVRSYQGNDNASEASGLTLDTHDPLPVSYAT